VNITLRQIQIFVAVANLGSTSAAAEELKISQPAVSSTLADFEANFGTKLFYRWKRGLVLNEVGRSFVPRARLIIANARDLESLLGTEKDQLFGTLQLGASTTPANYIIPQFLAEFIGSHSMVKIEVSCRNKSTIIEQIDSFSLDVGIIAGHCSRPNIQCSPWITDELCVFAAPDHPLCKKKDIAVEDLMREKWILREEGSGTREGLLMALPKNIKSDDIVMEFDSLEAIKRAVEHSSALGCISRAAVAREVDMGILSVLQTPFLNLSRQYSILIHQQRTQSTLLNYFCGYCLNEPPLPFTS
jgi:DNA-binding transcriptional LysR family regulator